MSNTLTGSYDPQQVTVTIAGIILSGFSDGEAIQARPAEDLNFVKVGVDGGVARARNANRMGEFEFRLLQTSKSNDELSAMLAIDNLAKGANLTFPIVIFDGSGRSLAAATQCWVKTQPTMVMGKEVSDRIWVFTAADLKMFHGGNS